LADRCKSSEGAAGRSIRIAVPETVPPRSQLRHSKGSVACRALRNGRPHARPEESTAPWPSVKGRTSRRGPTNTSAASVSGTGNSSFVSSAAQLSTTTTDAVHLAGDHQKSQSELLTFTSFFLTSGKSCSRYPRPLTCGDTELTHCLQSPTLGEDTRRETRTRWAKTYAR